MESTLEYEELKDRMLSWLEDKKHYLRKPIVQAAQMTKISLLLGSSLAQHRIEVQQQLEEAVQAETGKYIKMEVLTKMEKIRNKQNQQDSTPMLSSQVAQENKDVAKAGLRAVLSSGKPSPIGRRVSFLPTPNRTSRNSQSFICLMCKQKEMNLKERALSTNQLLDVKQRVKTKDGQELTIQQVICGLTDQGGSKIFTGAEIMGRSKQTLLTFNENIAPLARSTANHIAAALKMMIVETDHHLVEDYKK